LPPPASRNQQPTKPLIFYPPPKPAKPVNSGGVGQDAFLLKLTFTGLQEMLTPKSQL